MNISEKYEHEIRVYAWVDGNGVDGEVWITKNIVSNSRSFSDEELRTLAGFFGGDRAEYLRLVKSWAEIL